MTVIDEWLLVMTFIGGLALGSFLVAIIPPIWDEIISWRKNRKLEKQVEEARELREQILERWRDI